MMPLRPRVILPALQARACAFSSRGPRPETLSPPLGDALKRKLKMILRHKSNTAALSRKVRGSLTRSPAQLCFFWVGTRQKVVGGKRGEILPRYRNCSK